MLREDFQRAAKNLPRSFFLLFASIFLLSFSKEGRKTRNLKQKETLKENIIDLDWVPADLSFVQELKDML